MPMQSMMRIATAAALLALAACTGTLPGSVEQAPPAPKVDMAGRWLVITPGAPSCGMIFGAGTDSGTIKPEGGCPGDFFTSREWALANDDLTIRDHNGETLAQLHFGGGRFEGKSAKGLQVTIARSILPVN